MSDTIRVTWITRDERVIAGEVPVGRTLMEGAVSHSVDGIIGECGGALSCGTCHVLVENAPAPIGEPGTVENEMLDMLDVPRSQNSRLSCQLRATADLHGLVLRVP